jgi:hypothetical protein
MKTLKELKQESVNFYSENAATYFAASFNKKMGGTQIITFENDFLPQIKIDKREYYQGRGAKYNNTSMHEHLEVFVTKVQFNEKVDSRAKMLYAREKELNNRKSELRQFCKKYELNSKNYTQKGSCGIYFLFEKQSEIEKELNVDLTDFLNASGKTYFFAESKIGLLMFYHNNRQSYSFDFATEEQKNRFYSERENWVNAPYAHLLGQNNNINLYVC